MQQNPRGAGRMVTRSLISVALTLLLWSVGVDLSRGEMFSAVVHLQHAVEAELSLSEDLRAYIEKEQNRLQQLTRLADTFEQHGVWTMEKNPEVFLSNPLTAYRIIRDLYENVAAVRALLLEATENSNSFTNDSVLNTEWLPGDDDISGAVTAMLRLQDTYQIPTSHFIDGQLFADNTSFSSPDDPLPTLSDCVEIGIWAFYNDDYYHAILWLKEALGRLPADITSSAKIEILDCLSQALYKQGNTEMALEASTAILEMQSDLPHVINDVNNYISELSQTGIVRDGGPPVLRLKRHLTETDESEMFLLYEKLCRGENTPAPQEAKLLKCYHSTMGSHPLFMYVPLKIEILNGDPRIVFAHQFLSEEEISVIKNLSIPELHRSGVGPQTADEPEIGDFRTSKSAWLHDCNHTIIAKLSRRISAATNLNTSTVEDLQVLNYGIGGHYEPHFDFFEDDLSETVKESGDRILTWLNYLSNVHLGGATVFPVLGLTVWPEKGGAVMWHNLHKNGSGDRRTLHAACPVLSGVKWVANKWFHAYGNEFQRPCGMNQLE